MCGSWMGKGMGMGDVTNIAAVVCEVLDDLELLVVYAVVHDRVLERTAPAIAGVGTSLEKLLDLLLIPGSHCLAHLLVDFVLFSGVLPLAQILLWCRLRITSAS